MTDLLKRRCIAIKTKSLKIWNPGTIRCRFSIEYMHSLSGIIHEVDSVVQELFGRSKLGDTVSGDAVADL